MQAKLAKAEKKKAKKERKSAANDSTVACEEEVVSNGDKKKKKEKAANLSMPLLLPRHIIFATEEMLTVLSKAKAWYMDGTFSVVKKPFSQLYSVHVFIRHEKNVKQIPVLFILMSGKSKKDYVAVLRHLKSILPDTVAVREIILDFERAVWKAVKKVFPRATIKG